MFNLIPKIQRKPDSRVLDVADNLVEPLVDCTEENILKLCAPRPNDTYIIDAEDFRSSFSDPCNDYFPQPATWNMYFDYNHQDGGLVLENVRVLATMWELDDEWRHPDAHIITSNGKLVNRIYGSMELDDLLVRED